MYRPSCWSRNVRLFDYTYPAVILVMASILVLSTGNRCRSQENAQITGSRNRDPVIAECLSGGHKAASEGNFDEALRTFNACVEKHPNSAEAHFFLGMAYLQKEDIDKATGALKKAVQMDPNNLDAVATLGKVYSLDKQKLSLARELLERVLSFAPLKDDVRFALARVYELSGEKQKCLKEFQTIFVNEVRYGIYHFEFAKILIMDGEKNEARNHLDKALALAPDFEPAKRLRESLDKGSKGSGKPTEE